MIDDIFLCRLDLKAELRTHPHILFGKADERLVCFRSSFTCRHSVSRQYSFLEVPYLQGAGILLQHV